MQKKGDDTNILLVEMLKNIFYTVDIVQKKIHLGNILAV